MRSLPLYVTLVLASACASGGRPPATACAFDAKEIRAAERAVIAALEGSEPTAWVDHYTADAVLLESGEAVEGRDALLAMARGMKPLSSVVITPQHTEGHGNLAYVRGTGSWVSGSGATTRVRLLMIWRKERDGRWRIAYEVFVPAP